MGKKRDFIVEYAFFFIGMTVMSLGLVLMIQADLGVGPWDVLHLGVSYLTPLTIGIINILTGAVLVLLTIVINRKYVNLGCVINMVYIGLCIDAIFAIGWIPTAEH